MDDLTQKIDELEQRQKKIEAQNKRIISILTKGQNAADEEDSLVELFREVRRAPRGVPTERVAQVFEISNRSALDRMKTLSGEYEWLKYVRGRGKQPSRLFHKKNTLGGSG